MKKIVLTILFAVALNASAVVRKDTIAIGDSVAYPKIQEGKKYFAIYKGKKIRCAKGDKGKRAFIIYNINVAGERRISKNLLRKLIIKQLKSKKSMEKIKEQEVFKDENGILKCQLVYNTNVCVLNEIVIKGDLEIIIMMIIRNLEDDDETTTCIEIYNNNVPQDIIEKNYLYFSCEYNDIDNYQFDGHLKSQIDNTLNLSNKYRL